MSLLCRVGAPLPKVFLVLLATYLAGSFQLMAQTVYPQRSQPHGGDRRGTYLEPDKTIPLYKDPKLYLHNMELLAHVPEGVRLQMMTVGGQRYLVGGNVLDVTDPKNPVIVARNVPGGEVAYNQAMKKWILMRSDSCCSARQEYMQPGSQHPESVRPEGRLGVTFFDITDPRNPVEISHYDTGWPGAGSHGDGNYYDGGRYAYLAASVQGTRGQRPFHRTSRILVVLDVSDMSNPREISRWWVPGQMLGEDSEFQSWPEAGPHWLKEVWEPGLIYHWATFHGPCYVPKRVEDGGNRAYCAYGALGAIVLDLSDIRNPKEVTRVDISPPFDGGVPVHNAYPMLERKLMFVNGENTYWDCHEGIVMPWVVDMRAERHPVTIASFPVPKPPPEAPYNDFCFRGGRFGTHHVHDFKAPGKPRIDLMGYSWFTGGFRLYDVSNPFRPEEVAWIVPPQGEWRGTEKGFIEWDRKIIHVRTDTGLYILSSPVLGEPILGPMEAKQWSAEGLNIGAQ